MKPRTLLQGLAGLAAWGCLSGLALVRLWAVLYGRVPGPAILAAAAALAALVVGAAWRLRLVPRLLLPFGPTWRTALLAGAAFFLGALLDTSYGLFSVGDMAIGRLPFRLACALGSGLVLAGVVLALATAGRRFGRLELPRGRALLLLALAVNVLTALYAAGSATVYYWDSNIYWSSSTMLAGQSLDLAQVRLVLQSVITQEYNYLLSWPISLVMRVLGTGRYVYLFAIANLYVLPALAGMAALARRVRRGGLLLACALRAEGWPVLLKWPNDLVLSLPEGPRKLAGILLEERGGVLLAGIGVNVSFAPPDNALRADAALRAASLDQHPVPGRPAPLAEELWQRLVKHVHSAYNNGHSLSEQWKTRAEQLLLWRGRDVELIDGGRSVRGRLEGLTPAGGLSLLRNGRCEEWLSGSLRLSERLS